MTTKELENYGPKRELIGFPKEIIARMLDCQEEQGNERDVTVFEKNNSCSLGAGGFDWGITKEEDVFWYEVITKENFNVFFEKYPKQDNKDNSQEFKVGDKVIDIIYGEIGVIKRINLDAAYSIHVSFSDNTSDEYLINGVCRLYYKTPQLLHYRDDYDYTTIDFNNLPKRQEPKRWRAKKGELYYTITPAFKIGNCLEVYVDSDNEKFETGNYFQTEEQAQEVADKLKEYFNQLINPNK